MKHFFEAFYEALIAIGNFLKPLFLLAVRLFWGWQFFQTGMGKFSDLNAIANYFSTLGIPAPGINAFMAAAAETVGGLFLMLGLATRLVSIPLIVTMVVAFLTAHTDAVKMLWEDPTQILMQTPFTFLLASIITFVFGPGPISIDGLLKRWRG